MPTCTKPRPSIPTPDQIRRAPKVLLHDHLDGGLRPGTIVDLARATGYDALPETDPDKLGAWFREAADSGSLERYLETFAHTCAVMQTRDALVRVAAECAEDLAADGVVYAEVRYAPEQHLEGGLTLEEVVEAVNEGFREGERRAREDGHRIRVGALLTAMRHAARSQEIAELANRYRDSGVVGFDIAGAEAGLPAHPAPGRLRVPEAREQPLHHPRRRGLRPAVDLAGAAVVRRRPARPRRAHHRRHRGQAPTAGRARPARRRTCATSGSRWRCARRSNLQTGAADSYAEHPIGLLRRLHFRVTVNTDNRLMSGTSMSREFEHLVEAFGYTLDDMQWFTVNAMKSAFIPFDERLAMINEVIKPGYAELKAEWLFEPGDRRRPLASGSATGERLTAAAGGASGGGGGARRRRLRGG